MRENKPISRLAEANIDAFCVQLLGSKLSDPSVHDELLDHLRTAFHDEVNSGLDEADAIERIKSRFGDPQRIAALLQDKAGQSVTYRAIEFVVAWIIASALSMFCILIVINLFRFLPTPKSLDLSAAFALAAMILAVVFTAALITRWKKQPPGPIRPLLIVPLAVLLMLWMDSPLLTTMQSIGTVAGWDHRSLSDLSSQFHFAGHVASLIGFGWLVCRHLNAPASQRATIAYLVLACVIPLLSLFRWILTIYRISLFAPQLNHHAIPQIVSFSLVHMLIAWTLAYSIDLGAANMQRWRAASE